MGMEIEVDSLEDMCALMCDNIIPNNTEWKEISTITIMGSDDGISYELIATVPIDELALDRLEEAETIEFKNDKEFKYYTYEINVVEDSDEKKI